MKKISISLLVSVSMLSTSCVAQDATSLAKKKACFGCHQIDTKLIGPAYKDIAAKYKDDKNAETALATKIRRGSSGVWGAAVMPPNPQVNEEEARALVKWILSQK